jgi:hypothetical protein
MIDSQLQAANVHELTRLLLKDMVYGAGPTPENCAQFGNQITLVEAENIKRPSENLTQVVASARKICGPL